MIKAYLKTIVRQGIGKFGIGLEMFRLDADEAELTDEEKLAIEEDGGEASTTALVRVYEQIGENFWDGSGMSVKKFAEALDGLGDVSKLNIHINSLGGDAHTAQAIYNLIGDYEADTTSYIDGVAASAATIVASGSKRVVMRKNANYMVHNPWTLAMGNATALRKAAEDLDQVTEPILAVYKEQTGNKASKAKIIELMDNETWLTASEALSYGFVDEVRGKGLATASAGKGKLAIGGAIYNVARYGYHNIPNFPTVKMDDLDPIKLKSKQLLNKGKDKMTLAELQQMYPELMAEGNADAAKAERERLAALNAMNAPGLEAIVAKAIEDGSTPASIAMECFNIMKDNQASTAQTNALKRDAAPAGSVAAGDAPHKAPERSKASKVLADAFTKDSTQQHRAKTNGVRMLR